eukprot:SAG22_NODE_11597_length_478_cov_0.540897_1_plen_48_part_10
MDLEDVIEFASVTVRSHRPEMRCCLFHRHRGLYRHIGSHLMVFAALDR